MKTTGTFITNEEKVLLYKFLKYYFFEDGENDSITKNELVFKEVTKNIKNHSRSRYFEVFEDFDNFENNLDFESNLLRLIGIFLNFDAIYMELLNLTDYFVYNDNPNNVLYKSIFYNDVLRYFEICRDKFLYLDKDNTHFIDIVKKDIENLGKFVDGKKDRFTFLTTEKQKINIINAFLFYWFKFVAKYSAELNDILESNKEKLDSKGLVSYNNRKVEYITDENIIMGQRVLEYLKREWFKGV